MGVRQEAGWVHWGLDGGSAEPRVCTIMWAASQEDERGIGPVGSWLDNEQCRVHKSVGRLTFLQPLCRVLHRYRETAH